MPTEPLKPTSRELGIGGALTLPSEPMLRHVEGRRTPAAIGSNAGRRFADGVYETVELLAASYVAEGKSIPAAARLAADQLVNDHPGLADELVAESTFGQGGPGNGVVSDIAELSSESAIQRGSEVDGGLPDFDVAESPDGNLEVRRMDGEVRAVSVEELNQLQALAGEITDAGETPSEDLVNNAGNAVRRLLPGVEQRLTDEDAFLALRLAADPRELEIVTEALTRGEAPPPMLRTAASPVQWLVTVGVPALLKVLRTLGRKGTKRKRSDESDQPDLQRRQPIAKPTDEPSDTATEPDAESSDKSVADTEQNGLGAPPVANPHPLRTEELLELTVDASEFVRLPDNQRFLAAEDGGPDLGRAPSLDKDGELPVRLRRREITHVDEKLHRKNAQDVGYRDGLHLTLDVAANWNRMHRSRQGRILLVKTNGINKVAVVEVKKAPGGEYWRIVTSGVRSDDQLGEVIR